MKFIYVFAMVLVASQCEALRRVADPAAEKAKENAASAATGAAAGATADDKKAWGIGHCMTRFVCWLPGSDDAGTDGAADANTLDCYPGGKDATAKKDECDAACAAGADAGDVTCGTAPDCLDEANDAHYYCMKNCITPSDEDKDTACKDVECDTAADGMNKAGAKDGRCRAANTATKRRRSFLRRRMMRRLGRMTMARNMKGIHRVLRRMEKMGMHVCGQSGIVKILLYPVALIKCLFHKLYCLIKSDACANGNYVEIKMDCADAANKDHADCKKDANGDKKGGDVAFATCADKKDHDDCKMECKKADGSDGKDKDEDKCAGICDDTASTDIRCTA